MTRRKKRLSEAKAPKKRAGRPKAKSLPLPKEAAPVPAVPLPTSPPLGSSGELISDADLCALTGLSDSWHRKIAARGFFPPPVDSKYQKDAAIRGLFGYLREKESKSKAALAEKQELLLDKRIERAEFDLSVSRKEFKSTGEIAARLMAISEEQKSALQFHLLDRLPSLNAGLGAQAQRKNNREVFVAICKRFQDWAASVASVEEAAAAAKKLADNKRDPIAPEPRA